MRLALFPLAVVLLPGTTMPLHIFEPRYRQMIADALAGSREFGLVYVPPGMRDTELEYGWPLCVARIETYDPLPDGRSNILVRGVRRVAYHTLVLDDKAYREAIVSELPDLQTEDDYWPPLAFEALTLYRRAARAARTIADDPSPVPEPENDPALLAYAIADALDLDLPTKQQLLATRVVSKRLAQMVSLLEPIVPDLERRARIHRRASLN